MHMRHAHNEAKPRGSFVQRMVAALAAIAMLGGLGYVTTSSAIAEDDQNPSGDTSTL